MQYKMFEVDMIDKWRIVLSPFLKYAYASKTVNTQGKAAKTYSVETGNPKNSLNGTKTKPSIMADKTAPKPSIRNSLRGVLVN
ncbi:MAG: hypothetical protein ACJA2C_000672 [Marinoscillum sp.]|jgi:hypothetical protein